jgi:hypothetical protein
MGSSKRNDSTKARSRRRRHARPDERTSNRPPVKPDVGEIMGRLSDAISVVATAANALLGVQEREGSTAGPEVGDEITTLLHGVRCVRRAYDALDAVMHTMRPCELARTDVRVRRQTTPHSWW